MLREQIKDVDKVQVYVGDMFDTLITGQGGYHRTGSNYIVVAQGAGWDKEAQVAELTENLRFALMHEWNHAVLGEFGETWIEEALTEHIARSLQFGQHDVVSPGKRKDGGPNSYIDERELLDTILNAGAEQISVDNATRLYSSNNSGKEWKPSALLEKLDKSWGVTNLIQEVSLHVRQLESKYINAGLGPFEASATAAREARSDLLQQPEVVFYEGYTKPSKAELAKV